VIVLGDSQYGKAGVRLLRVCRDHDQAGGDAHRLRDLNVTIALSGDQAATHLSGDNSAVLTTDAQKNTVYAFAAEHGVDQIEDFALLLARHFVTSQPAISTARVSIDEYGWEPVGGTGHSFARSGREIRTAAVTHDDAGPAVTSGLRGLILLNTTGSEFWGFVRDRYTTLPETTDRILATEVNASWRHTAADVPWERSYLTARELLIDAFARTYSYSLQQTLFAMGRQVLEGLPELAEIHLSLPNKHHFDVDVSPFGLENSHEVFCPSDRPYGLIEGTLTVRGES